MKDKTMHIDEHPLQEESSAAYDHWMEAHRRLEAEMRKGDKGLLEAAKLDMKKAQEVYDDVCSRL